MTNFFISLYKYLGALIRLNLSRNLAYPLLVYLELTKRCNLKCKFCDIWRAKPDVSKETNLNDFIPLFDEAKENKVQLVTLTGGEPLLRPDIYDIVKELSKRNLTTSFTTNGTLLTRNNIRRLAKSGLQHITMSLDAPIAQLHDDLRGKKGTFRKAINGIKQISQLAPDIKVNVNMVLNKENFYFLSDMLHLCEELNISVLNVLPIHRIYPQSIYHKQDESLFFSGADDLEKLKKKIVEFKKQLRKSRVISMSDLYLDTIPSQYVGDAFPHRCFAGKLFCEIDSEGNVFPCYWKKMLIGNIKKQRLSSIWHSYEAKKARAALSNCSSCLHNCCAEPSLRFSPLFLLNNPFRLLKEYKSIVR